MSLPDWQAHGHSFKNNLPAFRTASLNPKLVSPLVHIMKKTRKAKANHRKNTKSELSIIPLASVDTWAACQSVMADAEEQMAELQRTIEWAREYARSRVSFSVDSIARR